MLFLSIPSTRETTASVWASFVLDVDPVSVVIITDAITRTMTSSLARRARKRVRGGWQARKRISGCWQARAPRYLYLRNVFVEIIMCVRVANVKLLTLTLILGFFLYPIILPLASPGAPESVDYWPMCFELDAPVLIKRKPTDCRECQFSSPNLPDGWSINFFTGAITGPAEAGDQGSIQVYVTSKAGVVNSTAVYEVVEVAPSFAQPIGLKVVQDVRVFAFTSAIIVLILQPCPRWLATY